MKNFFFFLICYLLLIFEGLYVKWFFAYTNINNFSFVLHLNIIFIFYISVMYDKNMGILFACLFGLFTDITHYGIIGIYTLAYPVYVWRVSKYFALENYYKTLLMFAALGSVVFVELWAFIIYRMLGITDVSYLAFIQFRLLSTTIFNAVIVVIIHYILVLYLRKKQKICQY